MSTAILVITNLPDEASAQTLAERIITERAAACVNRLSACHSTYYWQGKVETANEIPLLVKTTTSAYPRLEKLIFDAHPYELPEIITLPITGGLPAYLNWVSEESKE